MALPFRNVKDIYDQLHGAGAVSSSLPEWSNEMNNLSQTDLFNAGLTDNFIKDASVGIDRALEATGLPNLGGQFGAAVGGAVGNEEAGQRIGQGLPRMAVNFAPLMAAGLVTGGAAPLAYAAGLAGTGALSGAETYTQTGSAGAGLLSGLTNVAMPGVANLGESAVLRGLGAKYLSGPIADELGNVTGNVSRFFPTTGQHVAGFLGGQAAAAGLGEASSVGQALLSREPYHFSPSEAALNLTLGQLPFAAMHLAGKVVGREASAPTFTDVDAMLKASQQRIDENQVRQAAAMKTPIESLPDLEQAPVSPVIQAKLSATLAQIRGEKAAIIASGDGDAGRRLSDLDDQELSLMEQTQGQGVMGEQLTPESDRVGVAGTEHFSNPTTGYRIIKVADDIANRDAGFTPGDLVGYSTKGEKAPVVGQDGLTQFDVPVRYHTKGVKDNRVVADAARIVENPDLPLQRPPALRVATKIGDKVYTTPGALFHADVEHNQVLSESNPAEQGFVTPKGIYLNRKQAHDWAQARANGKLKLTNEFSFAEKGQIDANSLPEINKQLETTSGLDKQREFSADLTDVKSKLDAVQPGDTEGLRQGIEAFNGVLQKHGYEPLNDSQIAEYQAKVQAKDPQAAVSGKVNDLMLRIAQKEALMKEREANKQKDVDALAEAIKDPQIKDMWLNFEQSGRGGKGLFEKALRQWVEGGRVGGVDALRTRILETKKQGGVKTPIVNKSETAAKSPDADTEHVRAMRQSVAETITDGEFDDADAQEFRSAFADGSLTSDPKLREFSQQDNVKRWTQESNEELARLGVHERMDLVPSEPKETAKVDEAITEGQEENNSPTAIDVPIQRQNRPTPFVPQTPEEQARLAQLAPDSGGVGLVKELQRSSDPATKSLADTLAKNFPESLHRVFVNILQMSQEGYAQATGNREATVNLSHGTLMSNDPVRREQVIMHELMHGLTLAELDNPTNKALLDELEAQRQRLIDNLPEKLRLKLNDLINRNWISDYANGKASMFDLSSSPEWQQVMYGLMNAKELVTQGFTDGSMQKYMNVLKGPGKKGFGVFLDWVKRLLRIPTASDSEFSHFMDTTSAILKQGDYVSDVSNFFDRQFAQKGYAPGLVREQSRKALEVVQSMAVQPSKELLLHTLEQRAPITAEYRQAEQAMDQMFADGGEKADAANAVLGEMGAPKETLATLLTEHLSGNVSDMRDAMDMLPVEVTRYLFERARDMQDVLGAVRDAADAKNDGLVNLADPKSVRGVVGETLRSINNFLKIEQSHEQDRTRLARMQTVAPDAFFDSVLSEPSKVSSWLDEGMDEMRAKGWNYNWPFVPADLQNQGFVDLIKRDPGISNEEKQRILKFAGNAIPRNPVPERGNKGLLEKVGDAIGAIGGRSFEHFLQQPAQIARSNPIFGEWYSKAILLNAQIRNMVKESMSIFGRSLSPEGVIKEQPQQVELDKAYKALQSPAMRTALDQLLYLKQERGGKAVGPIDYKDPAVVQILSKLSETDRANLVSIDNKIRLSKVAADQQTLRSMQQVFATLGARVVMRDTGMKMEPAVDAANKVFDAVAQGQTNLQVSQAILASVAPKIQPEAFLNLLRFTQDSVEQHQTYAKYLAQNSDWVSAQRNGSYIFEYLKGGKMVKASAENMADAKERSGGREILNWRPNTREDNDAVFLGANANDIIPRLRELEQNQLDMLKNVMSPEDLAEFQRTSPIAQFERETNATQRGQNLDLKGRTLSKGAEELPWFENHIDWIQKNASYWQRRLLRTQGETMIQEPGTAGTATANLIRQHMSELLQRDPAIGRKIQALAFTWSIGFNPATIMANATQTYMRGVTELIRSGLGPIDALRHITQSWSDYAGHKVGGKPYRTPEEANFIRQALHDGQIDATIFDDNAAANEATSTNLKRVINKDRPQTVGQHVASAAGAYATAGSWLFRHGERANNEVMLLATFRALKKLNPEMLAADLQKQAYLTNAAANDVGGRANRSLGLYSGTGDFARTVAMTASSLQSYLLGSTFQLIRNLKAGLFRPTGLQPSEVFAARKAALYQLTAQFVAAGTLGMPFVSGALALLNQAFPELELNKKLRETVSSLLGGDTNNGHILSDMALSGIPSMFGWDFQSRLSAGNVLPGVSEYNGFQPEQLLGVPASLVTNWVNGAKKLASGDSQGGYAFVPPAIRGIVKLATGDATKDYRGRPVLTPTPGENVGLALGFQPKRLSDLNVADKMASQSQALETRRQGQQNQNLAEEALKGNFGTVRASLQASIAGDKNYNPVDAVRAIARSAEEMTFPKDLRREGNQADMDSRKQLLSSFSIDPSSPSEVQRLAFRQGIEQRLGLTQRDPQEQILAQTMDALRAQQPDATRAALRLTAEQTLRRTSPSRQALQSGLAGAAF